MPTQAPNLRREIAFLLADVARLLGTATDQKAGELGTTRARWAVLVRIERHQGLSQNELASLLDIQPITLARLLDKLCDEGLVERRLDPSDRRIRRLHLTDRAYPVIEMLSVLGAGILDEAFRGLDADRQRTLVETLTMIKTNLKRPHPASDEPVDADRRAS
jgi:MarR family transcriptional regulator, transcriptional regulator for hemolysin